MVRGEPQLGQVGNNLSIMPPRIWVNTLPHLRHFRFSNPANMIGGADMKNDSLCFYSIITDGK